VWLNDLAAIRSRCYDNYSSVAGGDEHVSDAIREVAAETSAKDDTAATRALEDPPAAPGLALAVLALALMMLELVATLSGNFK
jgi:hypothetical protein